MRPARMPSAACSALVCALACAGVVAPDPATLPRASDAPGFAQALTVRPFVFPQDHGPHPEFRQEWWYLTGNLDAANGERFGFELTFFRFALAPTAAAPAAAPPVAPSAWRAREIYMAHFAITDVARRHFRFAQKLSRGALGLAGAEAAPLKVWIDDWSLAEAAAAPGEPADAPHAWRVHAAEPGYELELVLSPQQAPVANGDAGLSRKSDQLADASYYYSIPHLTAHGRLIRDGRTLALAGLAWLDRDWGSGGLAPQQAGWDWFALQLSDGSSLMFYALRGRDGRPDAHSAGTWVSGAGEAQALRSTDVAITVTGEWRNAAGVRYPSGWRVRVGPQALELSIRPVLANQELNTTPPYWEGAVDVSGARAGHSLTGRGYVELTGYHTER
jgi:predicted secreted hydrolase